MNIEQALTRALIDPYDDQDDPNVLSGFCVPCGEPGAYEDDTDAKTIINNLKLAGYIIIPDGYIPPKP